MDKVLIHKAERIDGERVQEIEVNLNFIGKVELPAQEISEKELAEARAQEEERLKADDTSHIASIVAGENKIIVESGIFPTKEEVRAKYEI